MKIIFSPSKKQQQKSISSNITSQPFFQNQVTTLIEIIKKKTISDIKNIYKISDDLAEKTYMQFHNTVPVYTPALYSYAGTSFNQCLPETYSSESQDFAQSHVRILSALYGVLKPYDIIQEYRLDMNNKIFAKTSDYKNLYEFWHNSVLNYFKNEDYIINLASYEYSKMLSGIDKNKIITIHFLVYKKGNLKSVPVYAKKQRGKMLNYIIENKIYTAIELQKYSSDGFIFSNIKSTLNDYFFIKKS